MPSMSRGRGGDREPHKVGERQCHSAKGPEEGRQRQAADRVALVCVLPGCLQGLQTPWMSHGKQLELLSWTFPICPSGSHLEHGCFCLGPVSTDTSKRLETGGESSGYPTPPPKLVPCQTGLGSSCFPLVKASPAAGSRVPELQLLPVSATCPVPCVFRPRWRRLPLRLPLDVSSRLVDCL